MLVFCHTNRDDICSWVICTIFSWPNNLFSSPAAWHNLSREDFTLQAGGEQTSRRTSWSRTSVGPQVSKEVQCIFLMQPLPSKSWECYWLETERHTLYTPCSSTLTEYYLLDCSLLRFSPLNIFFIMWIWVRFFHMHINGTSFLEPRSMSTQQVLTSKKFSYVSCAKTS